MTLLKKISNDHPTHEHMKIVNDTTETLHRQQILAKTIADNLKKTNVKTPHFYITPKGSSIDCYTSKLSH